MGKGQEWPASCASRNEIAYSSVEWATDLRYSSPFHSRDYSDQL